MRVLVLFDDNQLEDHGLSRSLMFSETRSLSRSALILKGICMGYAKHPIPAPTAAEFAEADCPKNGLLGLMHFFYAHASIYFPLQMEVSNMACLVECLNKNGTIDPYYCMAWPDQFIYETDDNAPGVIDTDWGAVLLPATEEGQKVLEQLMDLSVFLTRKVEQDKEYQDQFIEQEVAEEMFLDYLLLEQ